MAENGMAAVQTNSPLDEGDEEKTSVRFGLWLDASKNGVSERIASLNRSLRQVVEVASEWMIIISAAVELMKPAGPTLSVCRQGTGCYWALQCATILRTADFQLLDLVGQEQNASWMACWRIKGPGGVEMEWQ